MKGVETVHKDYAERLADARAKVEASRKEAIDHLEALPHLDDREAVADSLEVIVTDIKEIAYYLDKVDVLTRLASARK